MDPIQGRIRFLKRLCETHPVSTEERLRCSWHRNKYQYYCRQDASDKYGAYLTDQKIIQKLARQTYYSALQKTAGQEIQTLQNGRCQHKGRKVEGVYDSLSAGIRELVVPYWDYEDIYLKKWREQPYRTLDRYRKSFETKRGIRVRSKSEWIIDDMLSELRIPALYEKELDLPFVTPVYPDFTIVNPFTYQVFYLEHIGMLDSPDYSEKFALRIQEYVCSGYSVRGQMIFTFESQHHPITRQYLECTLAQAGFTIPEKTWMADHF